MFRRTPTAAQFVDPHIGKEGFLDLFGRPARESACECERRADLSLPQALNLVNGRDHLRCGRRFKRTHRQSCASGAKTDQDLVEELYLASLSRFPTAAEMASATEVRAVSRAGIGTRRAEQHALRICCGHLSTARHFCTTIDKPKGEGSPC